MQSYSASVSDGSLGAPTSLKPDPVVLKRLNVILKNIGAALSRIFPMIHP